MKENLRDAKEISINSTFIIPPFLDRKGDFYI